MTLLLAGDIGGTKTILHLLLASSDGLVPVVAEQSFASQNYPDLTPIVREYLQAAQAQVGKACQPRAACFAIAGPVKDNTCVLTNLDWELTGDRLAQELQIEHVQLINDFAAIGYGIFGLKDADIYVLQAAEPDPTAPIAILGAGTGLGEGFLIPQGDDYRVFPAEGGHVDFAPRTLLEFDLLEDVRARYQLERVSTERIVSGQGIVAIYQFLRDRGEIPESAALATAMAAADSDRAALIAQAAAASDRLSEATLELFIGAYGAEAGNIALKFLPFGGLYIAGGIAAKNLDRLQSGSFLPAYRQKGRVSPLLDRVPIYVILNPKVGLIGAGLRARQLS
ncbi:MAG: glucokinase [Spirulinaceae cyanobacterium SM2_1_0]|nr:glucokinase [Spirulinaceae cyanobacterium SM2_1_0]